MPSDSANEHTELQESREEEQKDTLRDQPEEEKDTAEESVKKTVLQRTYQHSVLHSQSPAECVSASTPAGLTNGFPQKGLLQDNYKIRVDFKVSFCMSDEQAMTVTSFKEISISHI